MKHSLKKLISSLLTVIMVFGVLTVVPFTVNAASFTPRTTAPDSSNANYYSSNPFYQSGYGMPNCTCYAYGRAYELLGSKPRLSTGNAGYWWWYNKNNGIYSYGSTPKLGAIACWDKYDQNQGHVAVVEAIDGNTVTISESHYRSTFFDTRTITANSSNYLTSMRFLGYIYIGDFDTNPPDPVDLGTDFYAYIMNTNSWKPLVNDGSHNACFNYDVYENQKIWHFIKKSNGSYKIISLFDNNALDVDLGKSDSGTDVGVWTDSNTTNQEWFIYGSSAQFYLKPNCSDCVLDMTGGKYYDGVNAQIFTKNGTDAQLFQIWKVDIVGDFSIKSTVDNNIVNLDWTPSNNAEGYKVNIWNTDLIEDTPYCSCVTTNTHFSKELPKGNYRVCVFSYNNSSEKASNIIYITIKDVITSIDIDSLGFELSLSSNSYTYDGKAKTPTVTIKNDTTTLIKDTDYTVEYSNNINAGTATVTVIGIGNYTGTLTKTFIINKAQQTVNATISSNTIDIGNTSTIIASGQGTISYTSSNTDIATVNNSGIVTGISAGTATITVTATGNNNYNEASKTFTVLVKSAHVLGDVNSDGIVSIADATELQKYLANIIDFDDEQLAVADTNGDGSVSIADATQIQKYLAQLIPSLG